MKKFAKVVSLALAVTMCLALLVACGGAPNSDPEKAKAALEKNGYTVTLQEVNADGVEKMLVASKAGKTEKDTLGITIQWCKDDAAAEKLEKEGKETLEETKKLYEEMKEEMPDVVIGRSGKMVWMGSSQAVKDAQ